MNRPAMLLTMVIGLFASLAAAADQEQAANLLPNPSFEKIGDGKPADWQPHTWHGKATFGVADTGRTGGHSLTITSEAGADAAWHARVPE